jgi:thiamine-monophosphate kinase
MERTEIQKLGEFGLIERIKHQFDQTDLIGTKTIGDDAAVFAANAQQQLVSTELFLEGVHFDLSYVPLMHLGYKLVVAGISDIIAMNGIPSSILVGIGLSNRFSVEAVDELYHGIKQACADYGLSLGGGDTTASRAGLTLSITAVGHAAAENITFRNSAKANDILCTTGDIGGAYLGLQLLEREKAVFQANPEAQPEIDQFEYIVGRQLKPTARLDVIHQLKDLGVVPTAMIDLSDGLASDLLQLCKASKVGAHIFEEKLAIDDQSYLAATSLNLSPITAALNGGEDYELLLAIKQEDFDKLKAISDLNPIGYVTSTPECELIMKSGQRINIQAQGFGA